jgi:tetratricopeptide (TPR) repeat protein
MSIPTLCLNMIVKNESKIITRLFDSVLPIIDTYCICDTGSTDNTIEVIEQYFESKGIKGKIVQEPFKNFCHNRTFSLKACQGLSDYVLLMDADMKLKIGNFDKKDLLKGTSFNMLQGNDAFYYHNCRIVKNNGNYEYKGVTHEYLDCPSDDIKCVIDKNVLFIEDIGDGGCKSDKFQRDIQLLTQGIQDEPDNARYYFYLANSYHDIGQFEDAIKYYIERINKGGWNQEIWYSYYRIGKCYMGLKQHEKAIFHFIEGHNIIPERLENLHEVIHFYRMNGKNQLAFMYGQIARTILEKNLPRDSHLFLENDVYTHKIYYELSIISYYVGLKVIDDILIKIFNNTTNQNIVNNTISNLKFYNNYLIHSDIYNFNSQLTQKEIPDLFEKKIVSKPMVSSSPCIVKNPKGKGYLMNVRNVSYYITENGSYIIDNDYITTVNSCVILNSKFQPIDTHIFEPKIDYRRYIGIEDIRIFDDKFIGITYHSDEKIGVSIGKYDITKDTLEYNEYKQNFVHTNCEKNWVFVKYNKKDHIIYNWQPLRICEINEQKKEIIPIKDINMPNIFNHVRGSTCGFSFNNEIWFVGHMVAHENPRIYYHIISVFDKEMNLLRYTAPFKLTKSPIEYCLGIIVEPDRVIMSFSDWDRTSSVGIYNKSYIESKMFSNI